MTKPNLHRAANGHLTLDFEEYSSPEWSKAIAILEAELGYEQTGKSVLGMDESIMPSFVKGPISIASGCDNWSGNYLLSESKEADEVLLSLYDQLLSLSR